MAAWPACRNGAVAMAAYGGSNLCYISSVAAMYQQRKRSRKHVAA